jgi:cyclopropane fatty-acyl-phospholipid synthase-like methyltransferase
MTAPVKVSAKSGGATTTGGRAGELAGDGALARVLAWLARLRLWIVKETAPSVAAPPAATPEIRAAGQPAIAPLDRMTVAQWLWGEGFVMPGNADFILGIVKPVGLNPAMSMLDISAGLGGAARVIAQTYGIYVTGLERSPERAKRGMEMSVLAKLGKRAAISQFNPDTIELRPNSFDCVLARAATYDVVEKERLLRVVFQGLKPRGQLLLNEFVLDPSLADRPALAAWVARESHPPQLWAIEQYSDCLASLGFDIRVIEDISKTYQSMIVAGWARVLEVVNLRQMVRTHKLTIVDEAELWTLRLAALQSGALRVYRVIALAKKPMR